MSTQHKNMTLSNSSAKRITPNGTHSGMDITIQNLGTGYIYIGGDDVSSTSFGVRIDSGGAFGVELNGSDALYAIAENNGDQISVLMLSLEN